MSISVTLLAALAMAAQEGRVPASGTITMPDVRRLPTAVEVAPTVLHAGPERPVGPPPATPLSNTKREAGPVPSVAPTDIPRSLVFDIDSEGRHWVRGADYKASFGAEGAAFIPFFGSEAPRNFPITFALARAEQGGELTALAPPTVQREGERLVLDQGAVRTEYVAHLKGVEQLFVLDAPLGDGDLVLDLAVVSDLARRPDGAGWRFECRHGAVSYGAAFVIDAAGRRLDLETADTRDGFRFTVPAAFLARAAWPIAVDPLISNFPIDTYSADQLEVEVAYDTVSDRYIVVWEEVFSAADHDIFSVLLTGTGTVVPASLAGIDTTSANTADPSVAMTRVRRNFLCVFTSVLSTGSRGIFARPRNPDTLTSGAAFRVDAGSAADRLQPDVCGDAFNATALANYTIVWRRFWAANDSDIVVRVVGHDGTFVTDELFVTNVIGVSDEEPSISKGIPLGFNDSVVVWRRGTEILGSLISFNGGLVRAPFTLASTPEPKSAPQVSSLTPATLPGSSFSTFVACWTSAFSDRDIRAVVAAANNSASTPTVSSVQQLSFMEHVDYLLDQREPDVASVGDEGWLIVQNSVFPGFTDSVIFMMTVNIVGNGLGISERFEGLTGTFDETFTPKIASRHEAGTTGSNQALTGWIQASAAGQPGNVYGALHAADVSRTCAAQYVPCIGTPNGTTQSYRSFLWAEGDFSTATPKTLHAEDMHQNAFGYFLASLSAQPGTIPPGSLGRLCLGGAIGRYSGTVLNTGTTGSFSLVVSPTAISQPTGAVPALSGQRWYFQAWHRDVPIGGGAASSNFTNAAGIPFQ